MNNLVGYTEYLNESMGTAYYVAVEAEIKNTKKR